MPVHTACIDVGNACIYATTTIIARNDIPFIQPVHAFKLCLFKQIGIPYNVIVPNRRLGERPPFAICLVSYRHPFKRIVCRHTAWFISPTRRHISISSGTYQNCIGCCFYLCTLEYIFSTIAIRTLITPFRPNDRRTESRPSISTAWFGSYTYPLVFVRFGYSLWVVSPTRRHIIISIHGCWFTWCTACIAQIDKLYIRTVSTLCTILAR